MHSGVRIGACIDVPYVTGYSIFLLRNAMHACTVCMRTGSRCHEALIPGLGEECFREIDKDILLLMNWRPRLSVRWQLKSLGNV